MSRAYCRWSVDEDKQLAKELEERLTIAEIAKMHGRTVGAISSRRRLLERSEICELKAKINALEERVKKLESKV